MNPILKCATFCLASCCSYVVASIGITNMTSRGGDVHTATNRVNKTALFVQTAAGHPVAPAAPFVRPNKPNKPSSFGEVFWTGAWLATACCSSIQTLFVTMSPHN